MFFNKVPSNCISTRGLLSNNFLVYFVLWCGFIQFSKATGQIKEAILNLPVATKDEDMEEASALKDETELAHVDSHTKRDVSSVAIPEGTVKDDSDPFGLDALIPSKLKKDEKTKGKKEVATKIEEEKETKRFLKLQREALILCLEIAARRYKTPW